jgi:hypothetical protein
MIRRYAPGMTARSRRSDDLKIAGFSGARA